MSRLICVFLMSCFSSPLSFATDFSEKTKNNEDNGITGVDYTNKTISQSDICGATYKSFGIDSRMRKDKLDEFDTDFSSLIKHYDPVSKDQSDIFFNLAVKFSDKYHNNFPVGRVRELLSSKIHVTNGKSRFITKNLLEKENSEDTLKILTIQNPFKDYAYKLKLIGGNKNKYQNFVSTYLLLALETEFSHMRAGSISNLTEKDVKPTPVNGNRIFLTTDKKISSLLASQLNYLRSDTQKFDKFTKLIDASFFNNGTDEKDRKVALQSISSTLEGGKEAACDPSTPLTYKYEYIWVIWKLRNFARISKNRPLLDLSESYLGRIKVESQTSDARRWAEEALNNDDDHLPKRIWCGPVTEGPDGKMWVIEHGNYKKPDHPYDPKDYE